MALQGQMALLSRALFFCDCAVPCVLRHRLTAPLHHPQRCSRACWRSLATPWATGEACIPSTAAVVQPQTHSWAALFQSAVVGDLQSTRPRDHICPTQIAPCSGLDPPPEAIAAERDPHYRAVLDAVEYAIGRG